MYDLLNFFTRISLFLEFWYIDDFFDLFLNFFRVYFLELGQAFSEYIFAKIYSAEKNFLSFVELWFCNTAPHCSTFSQSFYKDFEAFFADCMEFCWTVFDRFFCSFTELFFVHFHKFCWEIFPFLTPISLQNTFRWYLFCVENREMEKHCYGLQVFHRILLAMLFHFIHNPMCILEIVRLTVLLKICTHFILPNSSCGGFGSSVARSIARYSPTLTSISSLLKL